MSEEFLRYVDSIHRDKGVSKDILFAAVEEALVAAAKKRFKTEAEVTVSIDRMTGKISATDGERIFELDELGRIAARTAYQVMTQRIREAERDVIYEDFEAKIDTLVTGTVQRIEHGNLVVTLGRTEGIVPRQEQVFNETYRAGDRIRVFILNVKKKGQKVIILLSRTHPNLVRELFKLEIPEVSDKIVELRNIVREPGFRTKVAVSSNDARVDPQGACIGVRGSRIRSIVDELSGERIDIIPWNDSAEIYIRKALSPAEIIAIDLDRDSMRARAIVPEDQLSLAIGKRGQNVRLAAKLTGWHIDILTEDEAHREREAMKAEMQKLSEIFEWIDNSMLETLTLSGFSTLHAIQKKGAERLLEVKGMDEDGAKELHVYAVGRVRELDEEKTLRIQEERARVREAAAAAAAAEAEAAAQAAAAAAEAGEGEAAEGAPDATAEAPSEGTGEGASDAVSEAASEEAGEGETEERADGAEAESVEPEAAQAEPDGDEQAASEGTGEGETEELADGAEAEPVEPEAAQVEPDGDEQAASEEAGEGETEELADGAEAEPVEPEAAQVEPDGDEQAASEGTEGDGESGENAPDEGAA